LRQPTRDGGHASAAPAVRREALGELIQHVAPGLREVRTLADSERRSIHVLDFVDPGSAEAALMALRADPTIEVVEPNAARFLTWEPDDTEFINQQWWLDEIGAPRAWDITTGSPEVVVAVIDSGVSPTQPDLANRLVAGYNAIDGGSDASDIDGHGTHVAGIIAAEANNGTGTAGIAMDVRIMPIRVMDSDGSIDVAAEIDAIYWAVDHGAQVINLSLGADEYISLEREAIQYARDHGVVVVAASGNESDGISYPAQYPETISVGSVNQDGNPSSFTSRLTRVDLAAPGESIYSPGWDSFYGDYWSDYFYSDYYPVSGTSFAAPMVAAAAALIKSVDPHADAEMIRAMLTSTARDSGQPGIDEGTGAGSLDIEAALRATTFNAMQALWAMTDQPVVDGAVNRTWLWGDTPFLHTYEGYDETQHGVRLVYYFDKSRMEVTNPLGDRAQRWYVTNGLLVNELVSGRMQVGDERFVTRTPARVNVAGDADDPFGPTYASFTNLRDAEPIAEGAMVFQTITRGGNVGINARLTDYGVTGAVWIPETNHRVASVFWAYLNSTGPIATTEGLIEGPLFDPWFFATGFPITEAYWARVNVAGIATDVLIQCFERRCLTYTPSNPAGWQVEMGNVGRHYYTWRYGDDPARGQGVGGSSGVSTHSERDPLNVTPGHMRDRSSLRLAG
jgi:type VII secretion-associated serine protease mycosin